MLYLVFTLLFDAKPQEIGRDSCFFISISFFHFIFLHAPHPSRKNVSRFLLVRPSWWPCRFHQKHCSAFSASRSFSQVPAFDKAKELWIWMGKDCYRLLHIEESIHRRNAQKIPPGTYILLVWKIRMPKDFPCWHMWTCGVWNRGLEMTETIPFFSSAIGQGSLHFQHDNLSETCTFIRILLRHGYGPKAFAEELWEALKYVLPASCLDEFAPEKQQTQVGKAQGWCFFLQYLPNYLQILVGLPFFCMHDHCQRKSLRNSSQLQDDICIHLQCI